MQRLISRRALIQGGITATVVLASSLPGFRAQAAALVPLAASDPTAKGLAFVTDASQVEAAANPTYQAGRNCGNCLQYQGKPTDAQAACTLFPGKSVPAHGWCKAWAAKP